MQYFFGYEIAYLRGTGNPAVRASDAADLEVVFKQQT